MCPRSLCYGDSNTFGYDPRSYLGGRYARSVRWTALLNAKGWTVINEGKNGRSIPRAAWEIEAAARAVSRSKADVLTVMLGSNDLLRHPGLAAEICGERMERFLTMILAEAPAGLRVLLVAPPPMEAGAWIHDERTLAESRRLAGRYEAAARRLGVGFADAGGWGVGLAYDGVHFSEEGHRAFARGIWTVLEGLSQGNGYPG